MEDKKICIRRIEIMIKEKHDTNEYIKGCIDTFFDCDKINDDEFKKLNILLKKRDKK